MVTTHFDPKEILSRYGHLGNGKLVFNILSGGQIELDLFKPFSALTFAASLTWDVGETPNATLELTGNVTTLTLENSLDGGAYTLRIAQDSTGSRTFAFPAAWYWAGTAPSISSGASDIDVLELRNISGDIYASLTKDWQT